MRVIFIIEQSASLINYSSKVTGSIITGFLSIAISTNMSTSNRISYDMWYTLVQGSPGTQLLPVFGGAVGATIGLDVVVVADGVDGRRSENSERLN